MFKNGAIANLILLAGPIIFGVPMVVIFTWARWINPFSTFFIVGSVLLIIGWLMLAYSKWGQIKNGEFFKFGPPSTSKTDKRFYGISYIMLIFGFIFVFSAR